MWDRKRLYLGSLVQNVSWMDKSSGGEMLFYAITFTSVQSNQWAIDTFWEHSTCLQILWCFPSQYRFISPNEKLEKKRSYTKRGKPKNQNWRKKVTSSMHQIRKWFGEIQSRVESFTLRVSTKPNLCCSLLIFHISIVFGIDSAALIRKGFLCSINELWNIIKGRCHLTLV